MDKLQNLIEILVETPIYFDLQSMKAWTTTYFGRLIINHNSTYIKPSTFWTKNN